MIFQTLDDKTECVGIYTNNQLYFERSQFPPGLTATWKYAPYLRDQNVDYVSLYLEGRSISEAVPEYLQEDWADVSKKIRSFKRSLSLAGVDMQQNCLFDLVPSRFLVDFCEVKNKITAHILQTIPRPERYEFYKHVSVLLEDIGQRPVTIDARYLNTFKSNSKYSSLVKTLTNCRPTVEYNQFGTKTGRLTTRPGSLPILTLNKLFRPAITPQNDFYVEIDFNGAEVRTLLGLLEKPQPTVDVHEYHLNHIFTALSTRDEAKVAFFAWLYGSRQAASLPAAHDLENFYNKDSLLEKYWKNEEITTPYKKTITGVGRHHALNYLVQSTAAELTLKQALKLDYLLRTQSLGSCVAFLVHDAIILDMKKEDSHLITMLCELMKSTNFGLFEVNVKKGNSLGSLRKWEVG